MSFDLNFVNDWVSRKDKQSPFYVPSSSESNVSPDLVDFRKLADVPSPSAETDEPIYNTQEEALKNAYETRSTSVVDTPSYTLDDLEDDETFQEVAARFLKSMDEDDDIFEYLRDSDYRVSSALYRGFNSGSWTDQQKQDYAFLRSAFDKADVGSFSNMVKATADGFIDFVTDPIHLLSVMMTPLTGAGVIAAGTRLGSTKLAANLAQSKALRSGIKKLRDANAISGVNYAVTEGIVQGTGSSVGNQMLEVNTNLRDSFSPSEVGLTGLIGGAAGGVLGLGGASALIGLRNSKSIQRVRERMEAKKEPKDVDPESRSETAKEWNKIQESIRNIAVVPKTISEGGTKFVNYLTGKATAPLVKYVKNSERLGEFLKAIRYDALRDFSGEVAEKAQISFGLALGTRTAKYRQTLQKIFADHNIERTGWTNHVTAVQNEQLSFLLNQTDLMSKIGIKEIKNEAGEVISYEFKGNIDEIAEKLNAAWKASRPMDMESLQDTQLKKLFGEKNVDRKATNITKDTVMAALRLRKLTNDVYVDATNIQSLDGSEVFTLFEKQQKIPFYFPRYYKLEAIKENREKFEELIFNSSHSKLNDDYITIKVRDPDDLDTIETKVDIKRLRRDEAYFKTYFDSIEGKPTTFKEVIELQAKKDGITLSPQEIETRARALKSKRLVQDMIDREFPALQFTDEVDNKPLRMQRTRVFYDVKDQDLIDGGFIENNIEQIYVNYFDDMAGAIERKRYLGTTLNEFQDRYVQDVRNDLIESGMDKKEANEVIKMMNDTYESVTGTTPRREPLLGEKFVGVQNFIKLTQQLAHLPLATISSLTEPLIILTKIDLEDTPEVFKAFGTAAGKQMKKSFSRFFTKFNGALKKAGISNRTVKGFKDLTDDEWAEAYTFSIATEYSAQQRLTSMYAGAVQGRITGAISEAFFKTTLLAPWTQAVQFGAFKSAKGVIKRLTKKLADGNLSKAEKERTIKKLWQIGIDHKKAVSNYKKFSVNGILDDAKYENSAFYQNDVLSSSNLFAREIILNPAASEANKPLWFNSPIGQLVMQFASYPTVFNNTVLKNMIREVRKDPIRNAPKLVAATSLMTGGAILTNAFRSEGRSLEESDGKVVADAISRWGGFGPLDYGFRYAKGIEYGGLTAGSTLKAPFGPLVADVVDAVQFRHTPLQIATQNLPFYSALPKDKRDALKSWARGTKADKPKNPFPIIDNRRFAKGGRVNVPNAVEEPEERKMRGLPFSYSDMAGPSVQDNEDRLGFVMGGVAKNIYRSAIKILNKEYDDKKWDVITRRIAVQSRATYDDWFESLPVSKQKEILEQEKLSKYDINTSEFIGDGTLAGGTYKGEGSVEPLKHVKEFYKAHPEISKLDELQFHLMRQMMDWQERQSFAMGGEVDTPENNNYAFSVLTKNDDYGRFLEDRDPIQTYEDSDMPEDTSKESYFVGLEENNYDEINRRVEDSIGLDVSKVSVNIKGANKVEGKVKVMNTLEVDKPTPENILEKLKQVKTMPKDVDVIKDMKFELDARDYALSSEGGSEAGSNLMQKSKSVVIKDGLFNLGYDSISYNNGKNIVLLKANQFMPIKIEKNTIRKKVYGGGLMRTLKRRSYDSGGVVAAVLSIFDKIPLTKRFLDIQHERMNIRETDKETFAKNLVRYADEIADIETRNDSQRVSDANAKGLHQFKAETVATVVNNFMSGRMPVGEQILKAVQAAGKKDPRNWTRDEANLMFLGHMFLTSEEKTYNRSTMTSDPLLRIIGTSKDQGKAYQQAAEFLYMKFHWRGEENSKEYGRALENFRNRYNPEMSFNYKGKEERSFAQVTDPSVMYRAGVPAIDADWYRSSSKVIEDKGLIARLKDIYEKATKEVDPINRSPFTKNPIYESFYEEEIIKPRDINLEPSVVQDHLLREHQEAYIAEETKKLNEVVMYPFMYDSEDTDYEDLELPEIKTPEVPSTDFGRFELRKHSRTSDYREPYAIGGLASALRKTISKGKHKAGTRLRRDYLNKNYLKDLKPTKKAAKDSQFNLSAENVFDLLQDGRVNIKQAQLLLQDAGFKKQTIKKILRPFKEVGLELGDDFVTYREPYVVGGLVKLFHGSGRKFKKFSSKFSEEGALGKGLYFTEDKKIAKNYTSMSDRDIRRMYSSKDFDKIKKRKAEDKSPTLYEVVADIKPEETILTGKPLSEQNKVIREKIAFLSTQLTKKQRDNINWDRGFWWKDLAKELNSSTDKIFPQIGINVIRKDVSKSLLKGRTLGGDVEYNIMNPEIVSITKTTEGGEVRQPYVVGGLVSRAANKISKFMLDFASKDPSKQSLRKQATTLEDYIAEDFSFTPREEGLNVKKKKKKTKRNMSVIPDSLKKYVSELEEAKADTRYLKDIVKVKQNKLQNMKFDYKLDDNQYLEALKALALIKNQQLVRTITLMKPFISKKVRKKLGLREVEDALMPDATEHDLITLLDDYNPDVNIGKEKLKDDLINSLMEAKQAPYKAMIENIKKIHAKGIANVSQAEEERLLTHIDAFLSTRDSQGAEGFIPNRFTDDNSINQAMDLFDYQSQEAVVPFDRFDLSTPEVPNELERKRMRADLIKEIEKLPTKPLSDRELRDLGFKLDEEDFMDSTDPDFLPSLFGEDIDPNVPENVTPLRPNLTFNKKTGKFEIVPPDLER